MILRHRQTLGWKPCSSDDECSSTESQSQNQPSHPGNSSKRGHSKKQRLPLEVVLQGFLVGAVAGFLLLFAGPFVICCLNGGNSGEAPPSSAPAAEVPPPPKPVEKSVRPPRGHLYGNLTYGLYRFDATKLGKEFMDAVAYFDEFIREGMDADAAEFAARRTKAPAVRAFHDQCYQYPDEDYLLHLEEAKKSRDLKNSKNRLDFLRGEQKLFYGPGMTLKHVTLSAGDKWAWRTAGHFGTQYSGGQTDFRDGANRRLQPAKSSNGRPYKSIFEKLGAKISGTFWYPPHAIREWHTNAWDGSSSRLWRMYYVHLKPANDDGGYYVDADVSSRAADTHENKSAMHLLGGMGIPAHRLEEYGAYRLTDHEGERPDVWRIPDRHGYVTLFRLSREKPYRWHCVLSDDNVHRYSMGMSLSDESVAALLSYAGVPL